MTTKTNGETLGVTLTNAGGLTSPSISVVAGDTTAPDAPTDLVVSADGLALTMYYMFAPWTRDAHIRADIVQIAPDVSGLVMAYQFGTNWSRFSDFAGAVTGPLLTYEVLPAAFWNWAATMR